MDCWGGATPQTPRRGFLVPAGTRKAQIFAFDLDAWRAIPLVVGFAMMAAGRAALKVWRFPCGVAVPNPFPAGQA